MRSLWTLFSKDPSFTNVFKPYLQLSNPQQRETSTAVATIYYCFHILTPKVRSSIFLESLWSENYQLPSLLNYSTYAIAYCMPSKGCSHVNHHRMGHSSQNLTQPTFGIMAMPRSRWRRVPDSLASHFLLDVYLPSPFLKFYIAEPCFEMLR